jgi:hypothetical protein
LTRNRPPARPGPRGYRARHDTTHHEPHARHSGPSAGILLIAAPCIFGFSDEGGAAVAVPIALGTLIIVQSLITDYELSVADLLPLPMHLGVDVVGGFILALSPFVFGFADEGTNVWLPHVVAGVGLIASGLMTQRHRKTPRVDSGRRSAHPAA